MALRTVLLALSMALGVAFGQTRPEPASPAPAPEKNEAPKAMPSGASDATTGAPIDPRSYVIGAEDILYIRVWREPDFTGPVAVRPDGKITLPLVGDLQASGLTPERLGEQVKQALSDLINKPDVTVMVSQVNSKKYTVTGGVNRPGTFPMVVATSVFDALNTAGGFREFANKKNILIIRGVKRLRFNYDDFVKGKHPEQNILLENGDTILVRE